MRHLTMGARDEGFSARNDDGSMGSMGVAGALIMAVVCLSILLRSSHVLHCTPRLRRRCDLFSTIGIDLALTDCLPP